MTHQFTDEQIEAVMNEVYRNVRHAHPQKIERSLVRLILEARAERDAADERNKTLQDALNHFGTVVSPRLIAERDAALARVRELEECPRWKDAAAMTRSAHARIAALEAEVNKLAAQRDAACVLGDHRIDALEAENADMRAQCVAVSNSFTNAKRIAENERLRGALEQDELRLGGNEPATEWHRGRLYTLKQLRAAMESDDE